MNGCRMLSCVALACTVLAGTIVGQVAITTHRTDAARTGANLTEQILNTSSVNSSNFGKLFTRAVDGYIYAQPLYLSQVRVVGGSTHNVVYVATEHNTVYAFDADVAADTAPLWKVSLGPPVPSGDVCEGTDSCSYTDLVPEIGITSTPVIDASTGTLYVVAKTKTDGSYQFTLHALDVASGQEKFGGPVEISASGFKPLYHLNRPGLLLLNDVVYIAFGSVGDLDTWHGWVMGYNASTLQQVAVFNATPGGNGGALWAGGQGLAADANSIYMMTGNGSFDANSGGQDFGDSVLKLNTSSGLSLADYFTPDNQSFLDGHDVDLGSGGPLLLPGTSLLVGVGKDGIVRLIDTTSMGKFNALVNNDVQEFTAVSGSCRGASGICFMGAPVYWDGPVLGQAIYLWGSSDYLKAFRFNGTTFETSPVSQGAVLAATGISNTVPLSVSANGSQAGTGIVWASAPSGDANAGAVPGILYAFDASDLTHELWDSKQNAAQDDVGNYAKFSPPTIANGKIYVPTFSGQLDVYGLTSGDFSINAEPALIAQAGQSATTSLKIIPQANGLTSPVSLSCSDLPAGTKCTFTPPSLPPGSQTMQSTLTVSADSAVANNNRGSRGSWPSRWLWLSGVCLGAVPFLGRFKRKTVWRVGLAFIAAGLLVAFGCGGGGSSGVPAAAPPVLPTAPPVLPTGTITVVATSGGIEHRSIIKLDAK